MADDFRLLRVTRLLLPCATIFSQLIELNVVVQFENRREFHALCYDFCRVPIHRRRRGEFVEICSMFGNGLRRVRRKLGGVV